MSSGGLPKAKLKVWFLETRPQFLPLSLLLVSLGGAIAWWHTRRFDPISFLLTLVGLVLAHIGINVLNDYFDYESKIDLETERTLFSGGSGILPAGLLEPETVYKFGVGSLASALLVGIYLTVISGWLLLLIIIAGGISGYFYSPRLAKWRIGEFAAGLCMGSLPVLGAYFVQTGSFTGEAIIPSLAPGFLTANLLLLNEFPDVRPDSKGGRNNLVIHLGKKKASRLYVALLGTVYLSIAVGVTTQLMPFTTLIGLATVPIAWKAARIALRYYAETERLIPGLRANVSVVLGTDALLAAAYIIAKTSSL